MFDEYGLDGVGDDRSERGFGVKKINRSCLLCG